MARKPPLSPEAQARMFARDRGYEVFDASDRNAWLELRQKDVTASVAGALFGDDVHEYQTRYGLWALKSIDPETGKPLVADDIEETKPMRRGRLLEDDAIEMLTEDFPTWSFFPSRLYFRDPRERIGATPDCFAIDPARKGFGNVQIKTVDASNFQKKWINAESGAIVPPDWILVQAIVEAKLCGASWTAIAVLVIGFGGMDVKLIHVDVHDGVWKRLHVEAREFWNFVDKRLAPPPDYKRDGDTILALFGREDGREIDLTKDNRIIALVDERARLKTIEATAKDAKKQRQALDAEIIHKMGVAAFARLADGRRITAKAVRREAHQVDASTFRDIRIKAAPAAQAAMAAATIDF